MKIQIPWRPKMPPKNFELQQLFARFSQVIVKHYNVNVMAFWLGQRKN